MQYLIERAREKSTWISVVTSLAGLVGMSISPDQTEAVAVVVIMILTLTGVLTKEEKK